MTSGDDRVIVIRVGITPEALAMRQEPRVILVNPSDWHVGYSFITPRWLYVIAQATPADTVGDPILVDEVIAEFDPLLVRAGDIVGIGICTGNCLAGYRVVRQAKERGARVIVGGIHATIFPDEPLRLGADAVVTGNGDVVWRSAIEDALNGKLRPRYDGGRVPGEGLLKARWNLLDPGRYLLPSVQTVAGCPENCSFCSVWVTDGRQPRERLSTKIIEEVNELYSMGYRFLVFADDNFNPATRARIERETSPKRRKELERIREERLRFFDEYGRSVPEDMQAFTQMTVEVASDEEYFTAMYSKMRIRTALVGIESFYSGGLAAANKSWSPVGERMVETIRLIQDRGILVLSSIICGLETDSVDSLRSMSRFARDTGSALAQFTVYRPYPGTKDYFEMLSDEKHRDQDGYSPKHLSRVTRQGFWLDARNAVDWFEHARLSSSQLISENKRCWDEFYAVPEILRRAWKGVARTWPIGGRLAYVFLSIVFHRVYAGHGISADNVQKKRGPITKLFIKLAILVYGFFFRNRVFRMKVSARPSTS